MTRFLFLAGLGALATIAVGQVRQHSFLMNAANGQPESISVCFAPEDPCAAKAIRAIDMAIVGIRMNAYSFTVGSGFAQALVRAKNRGVDVQVVADTTTPCGNGSATALLLDAGIPIWIDDKPPIAHEKAIIIDDHLVIAGSYNWTLQAARNSEDMNFIDNPDIATAYLTHWTMRQQLSRALTKDYVCHKAAREGIW